MNLSGPKRPLKALLVAAAAAAIVWTVWSQLSAQAPLYLLRLFGGASGGFVIPSGFAERFAPYSTERPDGRWGGCMLTDVGAFPDRAVFRFDCGAAGMHEFTLRPEGPQSYEILAAGSPGGRAAELSAGLKTTIDEVTSGERDVFIRAGSIGSATGLNHAVVLIAASTAGLFLLLLVSGLFGRITLSGRDWPAIAFLAAALLSRLALPIRSASEIMTYFLPPDLDGFFSDKHSVSYAGYKYLILSLFGGSHDALFLANIAAGSLTVIPVYLLMRDLFGRRAAAIACAMYSFQPLLIRFSATDAHMALLVFLLVSGVWLAGFGEKGGLSVFFGIATVGLAASMRVEGAVYLIMGMIGLSWAGGPARLSKHKAAAVSGLVCAIAFVAIQIYFKMNNWRGELGAGGHSWLENITLRDLSGAPVFLLTGSGWSTAVFQILAAAGVAVSAAKTIAPPGARTFSLGLLAAAFVLLVIYRPEYNAITAHRLYIPLTLLALAGAPGLSAAAGMLRPATAVRFAAPAMSAALLFSLLLSRGVLAESYTFNDEYAMLRKHLGGSKGCSLLYFTGNGDRGMHNPGIVTPEAEAIECEMNDCLARARAGGCVYYMRGSSCVFDDALELPVKTGSAGTLTVGARCKLLEASLALEPVEERRVDLEGTFRPRTSERTGKGAAVIGIYRVAGVR